MNIFIITLALVLSISTLVLGQRQAQCCQEYCYDLDSERVQAAHFGSKTSYSIAKGPESGRQYLVPNCNPVKIWMQTRHGTRLPEANTMERLKSLEEVSLYLNYFHCFFFLFFEFII